LGESGSGAWASMGKSVSLRVWGRCDRMMNRDESLTQKESPGSSESGFGREESGAPPLRVASFLKESGDKVTKQKKRSLWGEDARKP